MQTVAYSTLVRAGNVPRISPGIPLPFSRQTGGNGDWHYHGIPPSSRIPWAGLVISAGLHVFVLFSFNHPTAPVTKHVKEDADVIQMVMPDLKDLDEPPPTELQDETEKAPSVDVPTLSDAPSIVDVNMGFVQPLDLRPPVQADLTGARVSIVPVNISHGPRSDGGLKNIFNLSELDRIPEALSQVAPRFPPALKRDFSYAQVLVEFIVDTDGNVRAATAVESTYSGFDQAAVDGVSKWRFRPGMKMGHKVNTRMRVPIRFKVTDGTDS
jgi:protein TonB